MRRHWNYFKYIMRHKWFVMISSQKIGASMWQALIHDASKFLPSEWIPYANTFYKSDGSKQYDETPAFNVAWLKHQHRNPHHWQHWILRMDSGNTVAQEIPMRYVLEMIADWMGAGRAITGKWESAEWYANNRDKIVLHDKTRKIVDGIIFGDVAETLVGELAGVVKSVFSGEDTNPQEVLRYMESYVQAMIERDGKNGGGK